MLSTCETQAAYGYIGGMNPQQPGVAPPTPESNPYQFIMSPVKPPRKGLFGGMGGGNNSFIAKLVLIVGGAVILMIVLAVVVNVFFGGKTNTTSLEDLDATQQEIIRVAAENTQASDQPVINAGLNTQLSVATQQQQLTTYLAGLGVKVGNKALNLDKNAMTDEKLQEATAANNYDSEFTTIMIQELQGYTADLKTDYASATGTKARALLATDYQQAQLLLTQFNTAQQNLTSQ